MNLKQLNEFIKSESKEYNIGGERTAFLDGADFVIRLLNLSVGKSENPWISVGTPNINWPDEKVLGTNGSGYAVGMLHCNMNGKVFIEDDDRILFITHYQLLAKL